MKIILTEKDIKIEGLPPKYKDIFKEELVRALNRDEEFQKKIQEARDQIIRELVYGE